MSRVPVVAVIGRPNVGKSTLVNRIVGRKEAVVDAQSGVTRDRREFDAEWSGVEFCLIDTGGWEARPDKGIPAGIKVQSEVALSLADMAIFVADATTDISDDDLGIARLLQKSGKPYILVANKVDSPKQEHTYDHLWGLGLGQPFPLSALHGRGTGDFLDAVLAEMPAVDGDDPERVPLASLAIMGRPNVGKSTLLNKLAGEDRAIVSEIPGTTRDPVNIVVDLDGEPFEVIDTAGIKRRTKITDDVEFYSTLRAREVLWQSDVALLLIDGTRGASHQEQRLAEEIVKSGTGLIVLLNKWDVIDEKQRDFTEDSVADRLAFVSWAPVLRLSAKTGSRIHRLPKAIRMVLESARFRVSTGEIN
ncbi:MAG: ribosome biogenesis GTPase Der, partial [Acidobacteria bacterium]|nr:ribosome biogenesis GTPase Der [Acidobacteriota bacterium]